MGSSPFDTESIRQTYRGLFGAGSSRQPTISAVCEVIKRQPTKFIKGPIPLPWIIAAAQLPGKTVVVALLLKYLSGLQKTEIVKLEPKVVREFGIDRHTVYRGLKVLESDGLIQVSRADGQAPVVTIMGVSAIQAREKDVPS